jgi:hypothetical protein
MSPFPSVKVRRRDNANDNPDDVHEQKKEEKLDSDNKPKPKGIRKKEVEHEAFTRESRNSRSTSNQERSEK